MLKSLLGMTQPNLVRFFLALAVVGRKDTPEARNAPRGRLLWKLEVSCYARPSSNASPDSYFGCNPGNPECRCIHISLAISSEDGFTHNQTPG